MLAKEVIHKADQSRSKKVVYVQKKVALNKAEKALYIMLISVIFVLMIFLLNEKQIAINENILMSQLDDKINKTNLMTESLKEEVDRQSNYTSINRKVKPYGMSLEPQRVYNIKR